MTKIFELLFGCWLLGAVSAAAEPFEKTAPYTGVRWVQSPAVADVGPQTRVQVQLQGRWWELVSIAGVLAADIEGFSKENYGRRWQKRIGEDLPQLFAQMNKPLGQRVDLVLKNPQTGAVTALEGVPMTQANRRAVRDSNRADATDRRRGGEASDSRWLDRGAMLAAIDEFEAVLNERWSYRHASDADFAGALKELRDEVGSKKSLADFARQLDVVLAMGIDGHAQVRARRSGEHEAPGYLPFLLSDSDGGVVAFKPDRSGLLLEGFPYVSQIDGEPLSVWQEAAARRVVKGSPQLVRRRSLRSLREIGVVRAARGLAESAEVELTLVSAQGGESRKIRLPLAGSKPVYGRWPKGGSRVLDGGAGYLRLARMDDQAVEAIHTWMPRFRDTTGLVVDVRGNGGGARQALRALYPYLVRGDAAPRVVNVARARRHPAHGADHLAPRHLYPADSPRWGDTERRAIEGVARAFAPRWRGTDAHFGPWCYMLLRPADNPEAYAYGKPVVVLMDAGCFSATDIFLEGLRGLDGVVLMGAASSGGSARSMRVGLHAAPLTVRLGTMASYTVQGELFDGRGVMPDIEVLPEPGYFIGASDRVLDRARAWIAGHGRPAED